RQVEGLTECRHSGGKQAITAACQTQSAALMMDVGTQLRLLARLALTVRFHQAQSGLLNLIVTAEKLPDSVLRHFFTVQIALLL
ncbi:hypothetical protein, partial [Pantoea allii]|uniref:hypothetical protein n=1 Tax=Pantoea allii TaxID=574096 RepID=UPI003D3189D2